MIEINNTRPPLYDPEAVQPMRDELVYVGFEEATTPELVESILGEKNDKTILVMINSVCGCAAGSARPGATLSLQNNVIPDKFITVFAGQDRDAIDFLRQKYLENFPPSSPFMALVKNGEVLFTMPRHHIEGRTPEEISEALIEKYEEHCNNEGPSISEEAYAKLVHARACGSKIPLNEVNN
ncbi:MAG: BrxA/BrxB family bacilliredoxin [Melioribacteraceae bacterium]|nr:BrxA/BrxB family bacilliredoxin [Melioribacteraceae bacterium]MCF8354269.1 BrxA/BrxB family bacilliredoxin [Melioribacteraceae bacterium]MCF8394599.1 BrxA/BrxB family bacilliredoxin [Melioribacteraceae bacterium]MCF8419732.1 BrxA/BrxB family bacilliredoxin [Melioribacteraceae bacterium]